MTTNTSNGSPGRPPKNRLREHYRITEFVNRGGSLAWRVQGYRRDGSRLRENFEDQAAAILRRNELEAEFHGNDAVQDPAIRSTRLSQDALAIAERSIGRLDRPEDLLVAVDYWLRVGRHQKQGNGHVPRLDDAVQQFVSWVDQTPTLRGRTKDNLRVRIRMFANGVPDMPLDAVTADAIEKYLNARNVSPATRDNCRRVIGRLFSWCMERPRAWITVNPASDVVIERGEKPPPAILTVEECEAMLRSAERHRGGQLLPYVAVSLFGGLRPQESARLTWEQVNLKDAEIRLEGAQTKTKRSRVVTIGSTLAKWLSACKGKSFCPANWRRDFDIIKAAAGYGGRCGEGELKPWPEDAMRHTAISHKFRECGSYGLTAEWAGNSETIIKQHYQGKVSSDDTKRFNAILPTKGGRP